MAEAVLDWMEIRDAMKEELELVQNSAGAPAFAQVIPGEPIGLPLGGPYCCFWYLGRTDAREGRMTLGNVMYAARWQVMCLWPIQVERATLADWEADIATVDTNIRRRFRANSTINSTVTDLDILDSQLDYGELPGGRNPDGGVALFLYRVLQMEVRLDNLEGEEIAP